MPAIYVSGARCAVAIGTHASPQRDQRAKVLTLFHNDCFWIADQQFPDAPHRFSGVDYHVMYVSVSLRFP